MASQDKEFSYESLQDRESIVKYLNALSEAIQEGNLVLVRNGDRIELNTPELVKFDLRAKSKGSSAQVMLKFSWKNRKPGKRDVTPLIIRATEEDKSNT